MWIDSDRTREGVIFGLYDEADDEDKVLVKKHFLTTTCHGDVSMGAAVDDTANALMRRLKVTEDGVFELQRKQLVLQKREVGPGSEGLRTTCRLHVLIRT
jgi:hypothetical protein